MFNNYNLTDEEVLEIIEKYEKVGITTDSLFQLFYFPCVQFAASIAMTSISAGISSSGFKILIV